MRYFEFFDLPVAFQLDEQLLRERFLRNSKKYHPDFFALDSPEKQQEVLELSSLNNAAYRTLSDPDQRMRYILAESGLLEEGQQDLPQSFLQEMMAINEALMELEFDPDPTALANTLTAVATLENNLEREVAPYLASFEANTPTAPEHLAAIKKFFLKKRYLLRIKENLSKFANH